MKENQIEIVTNTSIIQKDEEVVDVEEDHVVPKSLNQAEKPVIEETHVDTDLVEEDFFSIQAEAESDKSEPAPSVTSYNESKEQSYTSSMIDSNSSKDEEEEEEPESNNEENETLVLEKSHERQDSDTDKHSLSSVDSGNGLSYEHTSSTNYNKVEEVVESAVVQEQVKIEEKTIVPSPEKENVNKSAKSVKGATAKKVDKPTNKRGGKAAAAVASNGPITYTFTSTARNAKRPAPKHSANRNKLSESKEPEIKNVDLKNIGEQDALNENGVEDLVVYEFNFPRKLCGKLIGKSGVHVDSIRSKTHTQIAVRNDALVEDLQVVCISGKVHDVDKALDIISHRFPAKLYPQISFKPISKPILYRRFDADNNEQAKVLVASSMFVELPEQVVEATSVVTAAAAVTTVKTPFSVHVTAIVNAAHVFIQLPTQSTFADLQELDKSMLNAYDSISNEAIANLVEPIEYGTICAAPTSYGWHRAMVTNYQTLDEILMQLPDYSEACGLATVKFLDYGGYLNIPVNQLKQLR